MSTRRYLSALACICTSAAVAVAGASSEQELALARRSRLYLVLDLSRQRLELKVRGMELDAVEVRDVELLLPGAGGAQPRAPELQLPTVWRVAHAPREEWRQVVAPPTLIPYPEGGEPPVPEVTATPEPVPPAEYRVELESGWILAIGADPPSTLGSRLLARLRTGWERLWGVPRPAPPPTVVVQTGAEDARRLLHVFRPGLAILVVAGS